MASGTIITADELNTSDRFLKRQDRRVWAASAKPSNKNFDVLATLAHCKYQIIFVLCDKPIDEVI